VKEKSKAVVIPAPKWEAIRFELEGTAPYLQAPRSRDKPYTTKEGWHGIPTAGIKRAMAQAAPFKGAKKTSVKLGIFVEAAGVDVDDGMTLCKITRGKPVPFEEAEAKWEKNAHVFEEGWRAEVVVRYDADAFKDQEVVQLLQSAGLEVGIGGHRVEVKGEYGSFAAAPK
jgi:hypothetical protein